MQIYFRHIRAAGLCAPGFRAWALRKGFTRRQITEFLKHGAPVEFVEKIDDALAKRVLAAARAEQEKEAARAEQEKEAAQRG